jgi:hypothetical protein
VGSEKVRELASQRVSEELAAGSEQHGGRGAEKEKAALAAAIFIS